MISMTTGHTSKVINGIQSIATVSKVSVKAGDSISIPCLYNLKYKDNVKCLCKGKWWSTCEYVAQTNQPDNSKPFSISDDQTQGIFTVTIHNPQDDGTSYWCAIKKNLFDVKQRFELSVTTGMPSLHVDEQEITAFEGGSVTVKFHDENPKVTNWCRLGSSSSTKCMSDQIGSIDGATVTINTSVSNVFTVTMSGLKTENSGWYWCDKEDLQMPVNITVTELTSTTSTTPTTSTTISTSTATTLQTATQNASLFTSAEPPTVQPSFSTVIGTGGESLQDKNKSSTLVYILPLVLLLLVVPTAFFGWRMKKKRNKTKTEVPVITGGAEVERDPDVHYATIFHNPDAASQLKQNNIPEETVTYSTIVLNPSV
ncbi:CMRF35-like molecule 8 isoform X2 [Gymnodraco acuticeps]|uniref:CMRF35-like molecule 8 isoform X2 n=1 Tax=Gymnodraco acuticeps TaxID=8218 RepID=A0A6P8W5I3_GYMAC|nr:CMRF35-like molecule 8 isoform X2 [Gymnodraco acuticeps]